MATSFDVSSKCNCGIPAVMVNGEAQNGAWRKKPNPKTGRPDPLDPGVFECRSCLVLKGVKLGAPGILGKADIIPGA